jgi:hypothetical protein
MGNNAGEPQVTFKLSLSCLLQNSLQSLSDGAGLVVLWLLRINVTMKMLGCLL